MNRDQWVPSQCGLVVGVSGIIAFGLLTALVQLRVLAGIDHTVTLALHAWVSPPVYAVSAVLSIMFSSELSLAFALLLSLLLWRRGYRWSCLAPLAFLPLMLLEVAMKSIVSQPPVPAEFHRSVYYPLANVELSGSFPSGHVIRSGFLCGFLAMAIGSQSRIWPRFASAGLVILIALVAMTRVYLGDHWSSDVIAGMVLGISWALLASLLLTTPQADARIATTRPGQ